MSTSITRYVKTPDRHHEVEIGTIEAAAGDSGEAEDGGDSEEDVESGGEGAAVTGPVWQEVPRAATTSNAKQ